MFVNSAGAKTYQSKSEGQDNQLNSYLQKLLTLSHKMLQGESEIFPIKPSIRKNRLQCMEGNHRQN